MAGAARRRRAVAQLDRARGLLPRAGAALQPAVRRSPAGAAGSGAADRQDADVYTSTLTMPYARRDGRLPIVTADPGPDTVLFAREQWGAQIEFAVASKFDVSWAVQSAFHAALSERAISVLSARDPVMSARHVANLPQVVVGLRPADGVPARLRHRADRHADRAQRADEPVLSRQLPAQGHSGVGRRRPLGRSRRRHRDRRARAHRGRTAGLHRAGADVSRASDAADAGAGAARSRLSARQARHQARARSRRPRNHRRRAHARPRRACSR